MLYLNAMSAPLLQEDIPILLSTYTSRQLGYSAFPSASLTYSTPCEYQILEYFLLIMCPRNVNCLFRVINTCAFWAQILIQTSSFLTCSLDTIRSIFLLDHTSIYSEGIVQHSLSHRRINIAYFFNNFIFLTNNSCFLLFGLACRNHLWLFQCTFGLLLL